MRIAHKLRWLIALIATYVAIQLVSKQTYFIDYFYYSKFYTFLSNKLRSITNFTSISIGDCIYLLLIVFIIYRSFSIKKKWKNNKWEVINVICKSLILFILLFNIFWGFNYYRTPLHERLNFTNTYSEAQLIEVTELLVERINLLHENYIQDKNSSLTISKNLDSIYNEASAGYNVLAKIYPEFTYKNPNVKSSLFSLPLTYMGFSGYINPFTNEAQINAKVPKINLFITASHEIAHQIGIGPEAEANFVGYLAAKNNPNDLFEYAACSFALRYCLSRYPFKTEDEFKNYMQKINPGIVAEWKSSKDFWIAHQTFVDSIFKFIYDKFLKVNQQEFGIDGYSRFLDLLIHYELEQKKDELI